MYWWQRRPRGRANLFSKFRGAAKYIENKFVQDNDRQLMGPHEETLTLQLVCGYFDSVEVLLESFDLGSCKVALDGGKFYSTTSGMLSLSSCVNIVNVNSVNEGYIYRLGK